MCKKGRFIGLTRKSYRDLKNKEGLVLERLRLSIELCFPNSGGDCQQSVAHSCLEF